MAYGGLLALAGAAAYANSLQGPFFFDDRRSIVGNATIRSLWPLTAVLHPPVQTPMAGRPLANLSFALNYALGGLGVTGYHLANVGIHILAVLVLFGLLRRLVALTLRSTDPRASDGLAFACALIWLLHPLNTEAVDYVTQRTESMVGLFYLTALYGSVRAWGPSAGVGGRSDAAAWRWNALAVAASVCGMATKESAATIPLAVLLADRAFHFPSFRDALTRRWRFYLCLATGWLLLLAFAGETPFFSPTGFRTHVSRWTYLANQAPAVASYLRLSLWPRHLIVDYGAPLPLSLAQVWPGAALVLALAVATLVAWWRAPMLGFWGVWFFLTLAPASSLIPIPTEVAAERRMYLPLIAVIVCLALAVRAAGCRLAARVRRDGDPPAGSFVHWAGWGLAGVVAVLLGAATVERNAEYRTAVSIWQTVLERRPQARAHANYAVALRDAGREDEALAELKIAAPEDLEAQHALGSALRERGDFRGAIAELNAFAQAEVPGDPEVASAREELRLARRALLVDLLKARRFPEAETEARTLLARDAANAEIHNLLGVALASQGRVGEAGREFAEAVRLNPTYQDARNNLERASGRR